MKKVNWITIGGIAGIVLIFFLFINTITFLFQSFGSSFPANLNKVISLILPPFNNAFIYFALIFFYLGFLFVAKKFDKRFLKIISLIAIILSSITFLCASFFDLINYYPSYLPVPLFILFIMFYGMISNALWGISLMFTVGLITLRKISRFSFVTGVLALIGLVGNLLMNGIVFFLVLKMNNNNLLYITQTISLFWNVIIYLLEVIILFRLNKIIRKIIKK